MKEPLENLEGWIIDRLQSRAKMMTDPPAEKETIMQSAVGAAMCAGGLSELYDILQIFFDWSEPQLQELVQKAKNQNGMT